MRSSRSGAGKHGASGFLCKNGKATGRRKIRRMPNEERLNSFMKNYDYLENDTTHAMDRTYDRDLPEACKYCAYGKLPSSAGTHCSGPCSIYLHGSKDD